MMFLY